jgi:hypothetical protein
VSPVKAVSKCKGYVWIGQNYNGTIEAYAKIDCPGPAHALIVDLRISKNMSPLAGRVARATASDIRVKHESVTVSTRGTSKLWCAHGHLDHSDTYSPASSLVKYGAIGTACINL